MLGVPAIVNGAEQANPKAVVIAQDMFSVEQHMSLMPVWCNEMPSHSLEDYWPQWVDVLVSFGYQFGST